MRHVRKGPEPKFFTDWKALDNPNWRANYGNLLNPVKEQIHRHIINEQDGLCCYCGIEITFESSHLEHFWPQAHFPGKTVEYINLFVSCMGKLSKNPPLRCGHHKRNYFDKENYLSPLDGSVESQFSYTLTGGVMPLTSKATKMLSILNLEARALQSRRTEALAGWFTEDFLINATRQDLQKIIARFQTPTAGTPAPCFQVIRRFAEQLI